MLSCPYDNREGGHNEAVHDACHERDGRHGQFRAVAYAANISQVGLAYRGRNRRNQALDGSSQRRRIALEEGVMLTTETEAIIFVVLAVASTAFLYWLGYRTLKK